MKGNCWSFLRLDGKTPSDERQGLCDKFNHQDVFCFLISTLAGGVGLNLVAANKVITFDPDWNPTNDQQAQDRSFRLGQLRKVEVIRLVSKGTVEEIQFLNQIRKSHLANIIQADTEERRLFREKEFQGIKALLQYRKEGFYGAIEKRYKKREQLHALSKTNWIDDIDSVIKGEDDEGPVPSSPSVRQSGGVSTMVWTDAVGESKFERNLVDEAMQSQDPVEAYNED